MPTVRSRASNSSSASIEARPSTFLTFVPKASLPQATYLALYETEQSDPAKAREALGKARADWEKRGRLSDTIEVVASLTARRLWPLA